MSKLPRPSTKEFTKFLSTVGYTYNHTGKHHVYNNERGEMVTVPERKEIGVGLLLELLAQIGSNRDEFMRWWNS